MKYIKVDKVWNSYDDIIRFLDVDGNLIDKNLKSSLTKDEILKGYEYMVLSRQQDTYMSQLQRQGRMLTFVPNYGEEALQVASAMTLSKDDWFVPAFRSNAAMLYLGVPLLNQFLYWNGNEQGSHYPEGVNVLPVNIPIATQCSHATGIAYGMKQMKKKAVAVSFVGNGGTTEGEFFEALNFAAVHKLPTVFCVNNNRWSISTPEHLEAVTPTIAIKGLSANVPGIIVDGNDLLASYEVMKEAVEFAKSNGPILVEFLTWRQGPHTTSDNPRIYRTEEQEKEAEKWEPFHRIEKYMLDNKLITELQIKKIQEDKLELVRQTFEKSTSMLVPTIDEVFDYTYEKLDPDLLEQKAKAKAFFGKGGK